MNVALRCPFPTECGPSWLPRRDAVLVGVFLSALQCADGLLTSLGVQRFGLQMEGNPFLRYLMGEFGPTQGVALLKATCIAVVLALVFISNFLPWVRRALGCVSIAYLLVAVMPWVYLLFINPAI